MKKGGSPKDTGISEITGKIVRVRHAHEYDMVFIEEIFKKHDIFTDDTDYRKFVIATDNGISVGCGQLKTISENPEISCVIVATEPKYSDVEPFIAGHLIEFASSHTVYMITKRVEDYKKMGFIEVKKKVKELDQPFAYACTKDKHATLMVYRK